MNLVDTHVHVFTQDLPMLAARRYTPAYDATLEDYREHGARAGITHTVLVQPSFLGFDNSHMLAALRRDPQRLRGVAVLPVDTPAAALDTLQRDGVVGVRLNLDGLALPPLHAPAWRVFLTELARRDMLVELHRAAIDLPALVPALLDAGVRVLVDHFGRPDDLLGRHDPGFQYLLSQAKTGRVWVKLAAGYRNGWTSADAQTAVEISVELLAHFGSGHLVWGSDWPHTRHEHQSIAGALTALEHGVPEPAQRQEILGTTAMRLFGF
ncbi:amidohydrolase family protein [Verticiella sediminum]|uniref:Amidohydrolase family protein n=1 Tax=Verticiella sediminum TaxID=1247510 RepID=A0A556AU32_9BURK|nr:amidohydrolase family protein [Verticiella sediminum]TSH96416.1 amidohydrolase family protein [Verticiella sediminum]